MTRHAMRPPEADDEKVPPVLVISATELGNRSGGVLREVGAGALVRVDDLRLKMTVGWLSAEPPARPAGISPESWSRALTALPEPGTAADRIARSDADDV